MASVFCASDLFEIAWSVAGSEEVEQSSAAGARTGGSIGSAGEAVKPTSPGRELINVLMITYYFPPSGGPGVQRVLKFVRYLPAEGYRPLVLTVPESADFPARDPSLSLDIPPEARVTRSPILEFYSLYRFLSGRKVRGQAIDIQSVSRRPMGWRARWLRSLRGAVFIPDGRVGWLPAATREGMKLCRREQPAAIFASGPPFTTHWIGRRIAARTGLPLVLDFRDPWTRAPFYPDRPGWARRLDERLERSCLRQASAIITVNRAIRDDLRARHLMLPAERFEIIPNGFDPADFRGLERRPPRLWTLAHTGSLTGSRIPHTLLEVLRTWLREEPDLSRELQIRFLGRLDSEMESLLAEPPLHQVARLEGYQPHRETIQALLDSHLLLLLIVDDGQSAGMVTGKLFEYLGSGTPILAIAPEGEAAEIIRATRAGRVVAPSDSRAIREALQEAREAYRAGRRAFGESDPASISAYTRPALTGRLARILDRLTTTSEPLPPPDVAH